MPGKTRCAPCNEWHKDYAHAKRKEINKLVFDHYGRACKCCKTTLDEVFLTLGHVNNDGAAHRREVGSEMKRWAVKNGFPDILETQCWNCNMAQYIGGVCPHQEQHGPQS